MSKFNPLGTFTHPQDSAPRPTQGVLWIGSLDNTKLTVKAQYNPKELQVDKNIPWKKKEQANKVNTSGLHLEFTGAEGRTMSVELLFDQYELGDAGDVGPLVKDLNDMASVWQGSSADEDKRRPHLCVATWGKTLETFTCVIESLSTKYTMFSSKGVPLRATCTLKLKEADAVDKAADTAAGTTRTP